MTPWILSQVDLRDAILDGEMLCWDKEDGIIREEGARVGEEAGAAAGAKAGAEEGEKVGATEAERIGGDEGERIGREIAGDEVGVVGLDLYSFLTPQ